jgi:hypothetical protein
VLIVFEKKFAKKLQGRFGKYDFQVGVLTDGEYKKPRRGVRGLGGRDVLSAYAGGPVRKKSREPAGVSISEVSKANRERLGFNYLKEPFKKQSSDIIKFTDAFFKLAFGKSQKRRAENLLQAVVRNPILKGEYGDNSAITRRIKGFNRGMIDTAQLFKALKAICNVRAKRV